MKRTYNGTCSMCGKEDCELTVIDDVDHVCEDCLEEKFIFCDECQEYWQCDAIEFFYLDDGRVLCEHCAEDIDEDDEEE